MHFDLFSPAIQKVFARLLLERNGADAGTRRLLPPLDEKEDPRGAKTSRVARWYRAVVKVMSRWSMVDGGSNLNVHYDSSSLFLCAVEKGRRRHDTRTRLCSWERALADSEAAVLRAPTFARKTGYTERGFNGVELDVVREKNLSCLSNVKFTLNYVYTTKLLKLFRRARPQGATKNGSIDTFFCRRGRCFRRRRRLRRWWCLFGWSHVLLFRIRIRICVLRQRFRRSSSFLLWRRFRCIARR